MHAVTSSDLTSHSRSKYFKNLSSLHTSYSMTMMISEVCTTIQAWLEETEQIVSSQTSFDTFQPAEVQEIVSRFQPVLQSSLSWEQVTLMVKAVSMLMYVTGNLVNMRDQIVEILDGLLYNFLHLSQKEKTAELNEEILDLVVQCSEAKEVKMMVLEGLVHCYA